MPYIRDVEPEFQDPLYVLTFWEDGSDEPFVVWPDSNDIPVPEKGEKLSLESLQYIRSENGDVSEIQEQEDMGEYVVESREFEYSFSRYTTENGDDVKETETEYLVANVELTVREV